MSDPFDEVRFEHERIVRNGRNPCGPPTRRQLLVARQIDPSAWSQHAEEHVSWAMRYGQTGSLSNFGGRYLVQRDVALANAFELLQRLDRQNHGLPDLEPFDARAMSTRLKKRVFELSRRHHTRYASHRAAEAVFFMKEVDGIPMPAPAMARDGSVVLTWAEEDRRAVVSIDVEGGMSLRIGNRSNDPIGITFSLWDGDGARRLIAATDWVHFRGRHPEPPQDESSRTSEEQTT